MKGEFIKSARQAWTRYDMERQAVIREARVESLKFKKDGTPHATPDVSFRCASCKETVKDYNIDHRDPVGKQPTWPITGDGSWERYFMRVFCKRENLQLLCIACHDIKTAEEKANAANHVSDL